MRHPERATILFLAPALAFACLLAPVPVRAADSFVETIAKFGRSGASGLVIEEDLSDEFYYQRYTVKGGRAVGKNLSIEGRYEFYTKDFDTLEANDNHFTTAAFGFDYLSPSDTAYTARMAPDFTYKQKYYEDAKNRDYRQFRAILPVTFRKKDDWMVKVTNCINDYAYPDAPTDMFRYYCKIEGEKDLFERFLTLEAFYRFEYVARQKLDNCWEDAASLSGKVRPGYPFAKAVTMGLQRYKSNTIMEEEREDSYDYQETDWHAKAEYDVCDKVDGYARYEHLDRIYADFNHNFTGFVFENTCYFEIVKSRDVSSKLKLNYLHKQMRYPYVSNPYAFHNNNFHAQYNVTKKDDWKAMASFETKFYEYPAVRTKDKIYYTWKASIEKYLWKKSLTVGFEYRHTYKNFLHKPHISEDQYTFNGIYKF